MKAGTRNIHTGLRLIALAAALLASGLFVACGGGGGGGGGGPATTSGVSVGQMASGSIIVNGIRFDDSGATIEIENDSTPSRGELRDGMIVEVTGTFNSDDATGTATRVRFEDTLEGPVTGLATSATGLVKTFSVLGQQVRAEQGVTLFDNAVGAVTFATLANDQVLEISGLPDLNGVIQATFIQKKADTTAAFVAAGGIFEVKGIIGTVSGNTFTIGGLTIDRSSAVMSGTPAVGQLAEVKGTSLTGATLIATSVEVNPDDLADAAKVEVEGFISALSTGARTFLINDQLVNYANAQFLGGIEADLADGLKVEAEGPIVGGVLAAVKIKFKESLRFEANVTTVDPIAGTLVLQGFPGLVVQTDGALTKIKDNLALGSFANTAVKLRGRLSGSTVLVTRLEMVNASPLGRTSVQGPVSTFNGVANSVTLFGQVVVNTVSINDVGAVGGSNFEIEDLKVSRAAFFATLNVGDIVKARADNGVANTLSWNQIEIELDD